MRKQLLLYYASFLIFFLLISLFRQWLSPVYLAFWIGGALGAILPDVDHLIYVYFLKPHELTSQRATRMISRGQLVSTFNLLASTRSERTGLIFHTATFQIVFAIFTFFVLSSSSSLLGRGIVLAFSLHLLIDQYLDFKQQGSLSNWFKNIDFNLNQDKAVFYWTGLAILLVLFGFLF